MEKSPGTTFLLNFLVPGAGHIYASGGERWGLLAAYLGCAALTPLLFVPVVALPVLWIVSMVQSSDITKEYNQRLAEAMRLHEQRLLESKRDEEVRREDESKKETSRISGSALARQLAKVAALGKAGILSAEELQREKAKILSSAYEGWTDEDLATFLSPFVGLVNEGSISQEELNEIKLMFEMLPRDPRMSLKAGV